MWSDSRRPPDSREEDSWLSDEQMRRVAPAETEPFQSPVPTRMVSNGEYMPHPQTDQQKHVEYRIKELADEAAHRLGTSRRAFLAGTGGMAAAFLAMNEVYGRKLFDVKPVEMYETAAQDLQSGKLARVLRTQAKLVAATTGGQQDVGGGSLLGAPTHRTVSAKVDAAGEAARSRR